MRGLALLALLILASCGAERVWAPDEAVTRALWRAEGPPTITLFTVISTRNGSGAHSALLVNGSHRALFDPAGTFRHPRVPERNDVLYGITDTVLDVYVDYHARVTYDVRIQELVVSPEQAEAALRAMQAHGPAGKATCNLAVTRVLSQVPGLENVPGGYFPMRTAEWFADLPGVSDRTISDDDANDNHNVLFVDPEPMLIDGGR